MKLVGRKITRNVKPAADAAPTAIINPVNGTIRLSGKVIESCDLEGKTVSIALADEDSDKTYLYTTPDTNGFKVSKGAISSRALSRELADSFSVERTNKFSVLINTEAETFEEYEGYTFFEITFKEIIGATTAVTDQKDEEPDMEYEADLEEEEAEGVIISSTTVTDFRNGFDIEEEV